MIAILCGCLDSMTYSVVNWIIFHCPVTVNTAIELVYLYICVLLVHIAQLNLKATFWFYLCKVFIYLYIFMLTLRTCSSQSVAD